LLKWPLPGEDQTMLFDPGILLVDGRSIAPAPFGSRTDAAL